MSGPGVRSFLTSGDWSMISRIYKEDHYILLHTKYESSGPCCFREEYFLCFPMTPLVRGMFGPQRHGWHDCRIYKGPL